MAKQTRKVYRKNRKNIKNINTRRLRKQKGGACNTKCPENCWEEERVNKRGQTYYVTVCGSHDFSEECHKYRGMQNCVACSQCGEWCISS